MSESTLITLVVAVLTALPPTIAALAALRQGKANAVETAANTVLTEETGKKVDQVIVKADEIHELTNSNLTAVKTALETANARIEVLERIIRQDRQRESAP